MAELVFTAPLWRHRSDTGWHFVTLPHDVADEIADRAEQRAEPGRRSFGSVRVEVTSGSTTWRTSVFPDRASRSYVLPVKQAVRRSEGLADGDEVPIRLQPVAS